MADICVYGIYGDICQKEEVSTMAEFTRIICCCRM